MIDLQRLRHRLADRRVRLWAASTLAVVLFHVGLFALVPAPTWTPPEAPVALEVRPIYLDLTPRQAPSRTSSARAPDQTLAAGGEPSPLRVRPARQPSPSPSLRAEPFAIIAPPPAPANRPIGRTVPNSWRERCGLGNGEVSEADYQACQNAFLNAATPSGPRPRPRGDPAQDFAAQGAARLRHYEYVRSPAPTGSGNAAGSDTPGSNFGMGDIDRSVVYAIGERPPVGE